MAATGFDELARLLRELSQRFGETAFTDRRRLVSLLSDRLPDSRRDIKVVAAAVDERVFASLAHCRPEQLSMEVERLAANLENGLGIRTDVAMPVVQACAYALALGPLPSQVGAASATVPVLPELVSAKGDGWIGLSEPVQPQPQPVAPPTMAASPAAVPAASSAARMKKIAYWAVPVVVLIGVGLNQLDNRPAETSSPPAQPQPSRPQPTPPMPTPPPTPQPVYQPQPQPAPVQPPVMPTPQPVPQPPPAQPVFYGGENVDFGIPPQSNLKSDVGNPTPLSVPGGHTVTTMQVASEMRQNHRMVLVDSLADDHPTTIQGAVYLPSAGQYGTLSDQVQSRLVNDLNAATRGQREEPIVFFCQGVRCWESYNAVLRAHAAGFPNVYWYRGGLQSWQAAGLPMQTLQR